jgi:hypothetical protein
VSERSELKAPFPWPGGKSRVADYVWTRLGNVDNFLEPFAGTLAVLLRRPADHFRSGYRVETVNDLNHYVVNFWRAVRSDPEKVAEYADWPVLESDLHARHKWLVRSAEAAEWRERMRTDPEAFDAKIAGWWVWGLCCWIGTGFCGIGVDWNQIPKLSHAVGENRPQLADAFDIGRGVNAGGGLSLQVPLLRANLGGYTGSGVNAYPTTGTCSARRAWLADWMQRLADRLRLVRTCYGHWSRICDSDSTLTRLGTTGVFLDPPYPEHSVCGKKSRDGSLYATDKGADLNKLRDEVRDWCQRWGSDKNIRVALCCYENDGYEPLLESGWELYAWEASGGYANQRRGGKGKAANAKRERILFSPGCVIAPSLFAHAAG